MTLPDSDALATYILADQVVNFSEPVDPNTDVDASGFNEAMASLAAMTRVSVRGFVVLTPGDGSATLTDHDAVWGNSYLVAPTVEYTNTGRYTITFPATVTDALGEEHAVNIRRIKSMHVEDDGNVWHISGQKVTANSVRLFIKDNNGDYADAIGKEVFFEVI